MQKIDIRISPGQKTKMGMSIPSVSMRPIKDCGNCSHCRADCYALKAWSMYKETRAAWTANGKSFRADPFASIQVVHNWLKRKRKLPRFFRIHVAGDFLSQDHLEAWSLLAGQWPAVKFLAFTKMYGLDYGVCPDNLQVVFSMWPGMPDTAPAGAPRAWMQDGTETRIPDDAIECPGRCEDCGMCWSLSSIGRDVYFHQH